MTHSNYPIDSDVASVFDSYPKEMQNKIKHLRKLILETASDIEENSKIQSIGNVEETLKWGEPSYLTSQSKSGSTIRIAWKKVNSDKYSIFFKCTANLVPIFKEKYPDTFDYGGNRSLSFSLSDAIPETELKQCIAMALTYHRNKNLDYDDRWKLVSAIK